MDVFVAGGGMILQDQILPSLYQLQRNGLVGNITVCARNRATLDALRGTEKIRRAFPASTFTGVVGSFDDVMYDLVPGNLAIIALPDQLHYAAVMQALAQEQHVLCVKPLVMKVTESEAIEKESRQRGRLVAVEYHKRFDDRSLMARQRYRAGLFGDFRLGTAILFEKWYYRHSNFQNWFTKENSDAFTYIGCHYVDLVAFITGLKPRAVSVHGIADKFPNGNEGWLWTDARVIFENDACLNVQNALGYPDAGPGPNVQGLTMYCSGVSEDGVPVGAMLRHSDQYRGLEYCYVRNPGGDGGTVYNEPSPDYFQYVDLGTEGIVPVGYGWRSIEFAVKQAIRVEASTDRVRAMEEIDQAGVLATPKNSRYNEHVVEAARHSIAAGGKLVRI
jgi:D-galacturonate reductase